jgi:hypothetical protein
MAIPIFLREGVAICLQFEINLELVGSSF